MLERRNFEEEEVCDAAEGQDVNLITAAIVTIAAMLAGTALAFAEDGAANGGVSSPAQGGSATLLKDGVSSPAAGNNTALLTGGAATLSDSETLTIYLEVGEGHNDVADTIRKQLRKSLTQGATSEDGTLVQLDVPSTYTVADVVEMFSGITHYWEGIIDDEGIDEDQESGEKCAGQVGLKPMLEYADTQAYESDMQARAADAVEDGQTFYLFWLKPIDKIDLAIDQPIEGTTVTIAEAGESSTPEQTPSPNVTATGEAHLAPEFTGGHGGYWLASIPAGFNRTPQPFAGTMQAHTNYYTVSYLYANYGYYFDRLTLGKVFVNGKHQVKLDAIDSPAGEVLLVYGEVPTTTAPSELIAITEQPEDVSVAFPDPTQFHVAVDHPELVKSYKWSIAVENELVDGSFEYMYFDLNGTSASTDTLVIPSTERDYHNWLVSCTITDIDGHTVTSRQAIRTISNPDDRKHVLYIREYAIQPGESLDLADKGLGTGTVTFEADGHNITFDSFKFSNAGPCLFDDTVCPATGIFLFCPKESPDEAGEYFMHFNGDSVIDNRYFDASSNTGGVTLNCFFATTDFPNSPTLVIDGDSPLTLKGGQFALRNDGELEIATDINVTPLDTNYCDAIRAHSIYVNEGVKLDLDCCGAGLIAAGGDIYLYDGAEITINSLMPRISNGNVVKALILASGNVNCQGASIAMSGRSVPEKSKVTNLTGIQFGGTLRCNATNISIDLDSQESGAVYTSNFNGIVGEGGSSSIEMTNGSSISIDFDVLEVFGATGILLYRNLDIEEGCSIAVNASALGRVIGLLVWNEILMDGANTSIDVSAKSYSTDSEKRAFGIICDKLSMTQPGSTAQVHAKAEDGAAFIAGATEEVDEVAGYDPAYVPTRIALDEATAVSVPHDGVISSYNYRNPYYTATILAGEAVYDPADTSAPAQEVRIDEQLAGALHQITFMDGDQALKTVELRAADYLGEADLPEAPAKEGLTFAGWQTEAGATVSFPAQFQEDTVLHASYISDDAESLTAAKGELAAKIISVNAELANASTSGGYTKESLAALREAVDAANQVLDDVDATESQVKAAQTNLLQAWRKLVPADPGPTEAELRHYEAVDALAVTLTSMYEDVDFGAYTAASVEKFKGVLEDANKVLEAEGSTTQQLLKAKSNVLIARKNLEKKRENTLSAKGKTVKLKAKKIGGKKVIAKKTTLKRTKAFKVSGGVGKLTFKKIEGNAKISITSAGKVVVKKGLKKGVYKVKATVTAAGNGTYKAKSATMTVTVKVR